MIGKLTGIIDSITGQTLVLDVHGVGYVVNVGMRTLAALGPVGTEARVAIETIVREDAITLYGFADAHEQFWFKTLTTVQGVGPRVALSILSACSPDQVALAIGAKDSSLLTRADGVGPKLATRIVMELKDKAGIGMGMGAALPANMSSVVAQSPKGKKTVVAANTSPAPQNDAGRIEDAVSALVNLGYGRAEAFQAVHAALQKQGEGAALPAIITQALKDMAA